MFPLATGRGTLGIRGTLFGNHCSNRKVWSGLNRLMIYTNGLAFVYTVTTSQFHKRRHLLSNLWIINIQQFGANQPASRTTVTRQVFWIHISWRKRITTTH